MDEFISSDPTHVLGGGGGGMTRWPNFMSYDGYCSHQHIHSEGNDYVA